MLMMTPPRALPDIYHLLVGSRLHYLLVLLVHYTVHVIIILI
jgi:hypothetical protein